MSSELIEESAPSAPTVNLGKYSAAAGLLGLVVIGIVLALAMSQSTDTPEGLARQTQLLSSYLYGLVFWTAISLGMYLLTVFNHMVRSSWTLSVLRILEAGGGWITLGFMALCFVPIAMKLGVLYPWVDSTDKLVLHKKGYLNTNFWTIRLVFYFATWIVTSWAFRQSVLKQERTKDFALENRRMSFAAPLFVLFAVTGTFAFIDWVMSLEPTWSSTMYALWFIIGSTLGAYALAVVLFNLNADKPPFSTFVTKDVIKDQGNMLFVLTMLWAYTSLSQYLIIWNGNLPENTQYYVRRESLGWNAVGLAAMVGQFFVPFFAILSPRTKKNSKNMRSIAGWIFAVHIIDFTFIVTPALPSHIDRIALLPVWAWDAFAWFGFGALWMCGFSLMFKQAPAFPTYDTRLQEAKARAH